MEGWRGYEATSWASRQPDILLFTGEKVDRKKTQEYFTEYYLSALMFHNRFKRFGLPFTGGWAEQPGYLIEVIEIFEHVYMQYAENEREKQSRKAGMSGGSRRTTNHSKR